MQHGEALRRLHDYQSSVFVSWTSGERWHVTPWGDRFRQVPIHEFILTRDSVRLRLFKRHIFRWDFRGQQ